FLSSFCISNPRKKLPLFVPLPQLQRRSHWDRGKRTARTVSGGRRQSALHHTAASASSKQESRTGQRTRQCAGHTLARTEKAQSRPPRPGAAPAPERFPARRTGRER